MRELTTIVVPGAVNKDTDITVPGNPRIGALKAVAVITLSSGAYSRTAKTIVRYAGTLGTGNAALKNHNTIRIGDAVTTADIIELRYYSVDELAGLKESYV